jgi:hypothetical protein
MKSMRTAFILAGVGVIASLGIVAYLMLWGPDHLELSGKSLQELFESGDLVPILVIPAVLIITAFTIRPFLRTIFPPEIKNGVTTQAKVLKVWDTGVSVNDNPQVGLLLEINPIGGAPFQAEAKTLVSRLNAALVQPGVMTEVKYDPQKPQRLKVLTIHVGDTALSLSKDGAPSNAEARLEEINNLREKGLITEEEYRLKREEILKAL